MFSEVFENPIVLGSKYFCLLDLDKLAIKISNQSDINKDLVILQVASAKHQMKQVQKLLLPPSSSQKSKR